MDYTLIKDLFLDSADYSEKSVKIGGWCRTNRVSKAFGFIELNDGTFFKNVQVVYEGDSFEKASKISVGSSVTVTGKLTLTPDAQQPFEIKADNIELDGASDSSYPLQKKRHSFEFLRTISHLRPRTNAFSAVFRIRSLAAFAIHKFFNERGFVYVNTPIITGSDCEGAGEMFRVTTLDINNVPRTADGRVDNSLDFFGKESNLSVSGQLYGECYAMAFRNIYTFGPTFRAENSNTPRHAAEFWMMEPEMAFADINDNMDIAEEMIKYIVSYVLENAPHEMVFFNDFVEKGLLDKLTKLVEADFGRVTYTEAITLLEKSGKSFEYPVKWGIDLQTEHERYLAETVFNKPVFVIDYPKEIKAFYMRLNDDGKTVGAMDMLVPSVGELIGGSQREERYDNLLSRIREMGLDEKDYDWYLELRKYGTVKHSGFGMGFERLIMYLTGMTNIRDVCAFPRTVNNLGL